MKKALFGMSLLMLALFTYATENVVEKRKDIDYFTAKNLVKKSPNYTETIYIDADASGANTGASWDNAYNSVEHVPFNEMEDYTQIWVAEGNYQTDGCITAPAGGFFGGFNGTESDLMQRDPDAHPVTLDGQGTHRILDITGHDTLVSGFNIVNGSANGPAEDNQNRGGGVFVKSGTLHDCNVMTSTASYAGGGIWCNYGTVIGCDIFECFANSSGGGIYNNGGAITDCSVHHCSATYDGGGIYNSGRVYDTSLFNNTSSSGAGVYSSFGSVYRLRAYNNTATDSGGGIYIYQGEVENCLVYNNTVDDGSGGGIYALSGTNVWNCTFIDNTASVGPAVRVGMNITNCIAVDIDPTDPGLPPFYYYDPDGGAIQNCSWWDLYINSTPPATSSTHKQADANGNMEEDPLFVSLQSTDPTAWDLHLKEGSPCINAGKSDGAPEFDIEGNARGTTPDMGVFEYVLKTGISSPVWNKLK